LGVIRLGICIGCIVIDNHEEQTMSCKRLLSRGIWTALLTLTCALPSFAQSGAGTNDHMKESQAMHQSMMDGMKQMQSMQMTGNMDQDFAMMMRDHHQQGLKMAQMELEHGKDPKMKAMAKKILETQKKEIEEFDAWLAKKK
jgi:hypothetical protein